MPSASRDNASARMASKPSVLNASIWMNVSIILADLRQSARIREGAIIANASPDSLVLRLTYRAKVIITFTAYIFFHFSEKSIVIRKT